MADAEGVAAPLQTAEAATGAQPEGEKNPPWQAVDNAVSGALIEQYGFLPLGVRYSAAEAARRVVEDWRSGEWG